MLIYFFICVQKILREDGSSKQWPYKHNQFSATMPNVVPITHGMPFAQVILKWLCLFGNSISIINNELIKKTR